MGTAIFVVILVVLVIAAIFLITAFTGLGINSPKAKKKPIKATVTTPGGKSLQYPSTYQSTYSQVTRKEGGSATKPTTSKPKSSTYKSKDRDYDYDDTYVGYVEPAAFDSGNYTYEAPSTSDDNSSRGSTYESSYGSSGSDYSSSSYGSSSSDYGSSSSYSSSSYDSGSSSSSSSSSYDSGSSSSSGGGWD